MTRNIYLASKSPRRIELLNRFDLDFKIIENQYKEKNIESKNPAILAMMNAFNKAKSVEDKVEKGSLILGADTIIYHDSKIIGKAKDREEAKLILKSFSGKEHQVITGISIIRAGEDCKLIDYSKSIVKFKDLTDSKIDRYLDTEEYIDKAGAYGIQGYGGVFVEYIIGSYYNIVGLPIDKVDTLLERDFKIKLF